MVGIGIICFQVTGEGSNRVREKIQRQREAVPVTEVGSQCKLTFKMPGITSFDLSATVTSPGGVTEDAEINEVEDGLYAVHFVPKELGVHTVCVKYKEIHIPGMLAFEPNPTYYILFLYFSQSSFLMQSYI